MEFVQNGICARLPEKSSPIPLPLVPPPASMNITSIDDKIKEDLEEEDPPTAPAPRNTDPSTAPRGSVKYAEWENNRRAIHDFKRAVYSFPGDQTKHAMKPSLKNSSFMITPASEAKFQNNLIFTNAEP
jgi:hypothetical protein